MPQHKNGRGPQKQLREYHFDCGNTDKGTVGFCAVVRATTQEEAISTLAAAMPEEYETQLELNDDRIAYFRFYLNGSNLTRYSVDSYENVMTCSECKEPAPINGGLIGCPDGAEICQDCFNAGKH